MPTTRDRILNFIERNHTVTCAEISNAFGVSRVNIRYHLDILLNQGFIEIIGKKKSKRKGRPDLIFSLSKFSKGNNLDKLLNALFVEIKNRYPDQYDEILRSIAARFSECIPAVRAKTPQISESLQLIQKLLTTIEVLDKLYYQAHWEAHADGPRIILKNCPYWQIEPQHPSICHLDKYLIETLLKSSVYQAGKLELDERGIPHCTFVVSN